MNESMNPPVPVHDDINDDTLCPESLEMTIEEI